jgi:hypothetical protein
MWCALSGRGGSTKGWLCRLVLAVLRRLIRRRSPPVNLPDNR